MAILFFDRTPAPYPGMVAGQIPARGMLAGQGESI